MKVTQIDVNEHLLNNKSSRTDEQNNNWTCRQLSKTICIEVRHIKNIQHIGTYLMIEVTDSKEKGKPRTIVTNEYS